MSGNDTNNPPTTPEPEPSDTFALVGHAIRAEILQIFWNRTENRFLSLSEVREQMGTDVEPSQLHYHLQQLVGQFLEKTDDGYDLLPTGARVVASLRSGSFTQHQETMSGDAGFACNNCGTPVVASLADGVVEIECPECEYSYFEYPLIYIPLDTFEDPAAAFEQFRKYTALNDLFIARSVCPNCGHDLSTEIFADEDHPGDNKVCIDQWCDHCGIGWGLSVGELLRADPGLVGFCHDHGLDILSTPHWELKSVLSDDKVTIRSTDPWDVALKVTFDDETLELVIDDDLNVIERNRMAASGADEMVLPDKDACLQSLRRHRWPDGVMCPTCNSSNTTKEGKTPKDVQRYKCHECDITFNDLTGTIFAGRQLTIPEMFHTIREMDETEKTKIAQQLDRSYRSILDFVHKVQETSDEEFDSDLSDVCDDVDIR